MTADGLGSLCRAGLVASVAFAGAISAFPLAAQLPPGTTVGASAYLEAVSFSEPDLAGLDKVDLSSFLFAGRADLGRYVRLGISGGYATSSLRRPDGSEATLSGLTDTQVTLSIPLARDFVVLSLIGVLPTGKSEQDAIEAEVASIIAVDLLPFRISHWGAGGGLGASIGFARPIGPIGVALGVGYVLGREYNPFLDEDFAYRPGNAFTLTGGVDAGVGRGGKLALQVALQTFSDDRVDGGNLYQAGDRLQVMGSYAFPLGLGSGMAYAGVVHRQSGALGDAGAAFTVLGSEPGSPSQDLILVGGGVRMAIGTGILAPDVSVRAFRREDGVGQGYVSRLGVGYEFPIQQMTLIPVVRAKLGNLKGEDGASSGLTGFDLGLTIRYGGTGR